MALLGTTSTVTIGVLDSGFGALSVLARLRVALPNHDFLCISDTKNAPYGSKSKPDILACTTACLAILFEQGAQVVVIACNTICVTVFSELQAWISVHYPTRHLMSIVPATVRGIQVEPFRKLGLLATPATVASGVYGRLLPGFSLCSEACPTWASLVETDGFRTSVGRAVIRKHVEAVTRQAPDTEALALLCTHYPFLAAEIRAITSLPMIAQGDFVAAELTMFLHHVGLNAISLVRGSCRYLTTGDGRQYCQIASRLLGEVIDGETVAPLSDPPPSPRRYLPARRTPWSSLMK